MRYHRGNSRYQQSFLSIDDQVSKSNVIRVIDEICEEFCATVTIVIVKGQKETGRKAYHPADLLKILVYGYFNGVSSSRKLERETQRNIEMKWLTSDAAPDHKTISDFRKDNPDLVDGLFKYLIVRFKEKGLITGKSIVVDGTKIKAYASKEINIETIRQKLDTIEQQVEKYLRNIDTLDKAEDEIEEAEDEVKEIERKKAELEKELERLDAKKKKYLHLEEYLESIGKDRVSVTDADSKVMRGRYGKYWGYNAQSAVDTEHHLIVAVKTTDNQNDKGLLAPMVEASEETTGQMPEESIADAGYYKITDLEELEKEGTECFVAINRTASQVKDQNQGIKFIYNEKEDRYSCQEGKSLEYSRKRTIDGRAVKVYKGIECHLCPIQKKCTTAEQRTVHRNENQEWIDSFHKKISGPIGKEKLIKRRSVVEHPFGTMKYYMGQIPLLLRGREKVQTEMNLYAIGYNLKRYFNILAMENEKSRKGKTRLAA